MFKPTPAERAIRKAQGFALLCMLAAIAARVHTYLTDLGVLQ